jgi:hypothetical protein
MGWNPSDEEVLFRLFRMGAINRLLVFRVTKDDLGNKVLTTNQTLKKEATIAYEEMTALLVDSSHRPVP